MVKLNITKIFAGVVCVASLATPLHVQANNELPPPEFDFTEPHIFPDYVYAHASYKNLNADEHCIDTHKNTIDIATGKMATLIRTFQEKVGETGKKTFSFLWNNPVPICVWDSELVKNDGYIRSASFDWRSPTGEDKFSPIIEISSLKDLPDDFLDLFHEAFHYYQLSKTEIRPDSRYNFVQLLLLTGFMEASAYAFEAVIKHEILSKQGRSDEMLVMHPEDKGISDEIGNIYARNFIKGKSVAWRKAMDGYFNTDLWKQSVRDFSMNIAAKAQGLVNAGEGRKTIGEDDFIKIITPIGFPETVLEETGGFNHNDYKKYIPRKYLDKLSEINNLSITFYDNKTSPRGLDF